MSQTPQNEWKWYGYAGHFSGGSACAYHLCTRIGGFLISTLGDYRPPSRGGKRQLLGLANDSWFETFVFHCEGEDENGDPIVPSFNEIDSRRYGTSIEAERGHYEFCQKYAAKLDPKRH